MQQRIWFITGASSGLGAALSAAVLARDEFVIGTFRQAAQAAEFTVQHSPNALGLVLDLQDPSSIEAAAVKVKAQFGRIDVLVNNAGVGLIGAIEETQMAQARAVMEANFFGVLQLTQAFLPILRSQHHGIIFQISSHGGIKAFPGFGIYNASKFALEGFSEALAAEVEPLGIQVCIIEPGPFRTQFAGRSMLHAEGEIADYQSTAGAFRLRMASVNGQQEGDPQKAAQAIFELSEQAKLPLRQPLGKIALGTISAKLDSVKADLERGRNIAEGTVH